MSQSCLMGGFPAAASPHEDASGNDVSGGIFYRDRHHAIFENGAVDSPILQRLRQRWIYHNFFPSVFPERLGLEICPLRACIPFLW